MWKNRWRRFTSRWNTEPRCSAAPAERLANQQHVLAYAIAALIGIYLLLQVACNSWRVATLVMLMLPLSMVGGLAAAYASGGIISYGSMLGFVAVLAIAARSCVLLVRRYQQSGHPCPRQSRSIPQWRRSI